MGVRAPLPNSGKYFSGNYHVKFRHFGGKYHVNFGNFVIFFRQISKFGHFDIFFGFSVPAGTRVKGKKANGVLSNLCFIKYTRQTAGCRNQCAVENVRE